MSIQFNISHYTFSIHLLIFVVLKVIFSISILETLSLVITFEIKVWETNQWKDRLNQNVRMEQYKFDRVLELKYIGFIPTSDNNVSKKIDNQIKSVNIFICSAIYYVI